MQHVVGRSIDGLHALRQEHHLSLPQLGALRFLRAEGTQSVSAIAHHVQLSLAATSHHGAAVRGGSRGGVGLGHRTTTTYDP